VIRGLRHKRHHAFSRISVLGSHLAHAGLASRADSLSRSALRRETGTALPAPGSFRHTRAAPAEQRRRSVRSWGRLECCRFHDERPIGDKLASGCCSVQGLEPHASRSAGRLTAYSVRSGGPLLPVAMVEVRISSLVPRRSLLGALHAGRGSRSCPWDSLAIAGPLGTPPNAQVAEGAASLRPARVQASATRSWPWLRKARCASSEQLLELDY